MRTENLNPDSRMEFSERTTAYGPFGYLSCLQGLLGLIADSGSIRQIIKEAISEGQQAQERQS
jgi:hypothetical protein